MIVTFEIEETQKTEQILIIDDQFFEESETFFLMLDPINNLDEGAFPVVVFDDIINITIIDEDGMYVLIIQGNIHGIPELWDAFFISSI